MNVAERIRGYETKETHGLLPRPLEIRKHSTAALGADRAERAAANALIVAGQGERSIGRQYIDDTIRPDTPLHKSEPGDEHIIHAPAPTRRATLLNTKTSPGAAPPLDNVSDPAADSTANEQEMHHSFSREVRLKPTAHFHGTRGHCVRHGRKLRRNTGQVPRDVKPARSIFDRPKDGAYHPFGFIQPSRHLKRSNLDATNPYNFLTSRVGDEQAHTDVCPDCHAELRIRRRETLGAINSSAQDWTCSKRQVSPPKKESMAAQQGFLSPRPPGRERSPNSMIVECSSPSPLSPMTASAPSLTQRYTAHKPSEQYLDQESREQTCIPEATSPCSSTRSNWHSVRGTPTTPTAPTAPTRERSRAVHFEDSPSRDDGNGLIVAQDLGDGLDAMIMERGGRLERVVVNLRKSVSMVEMMAKLAQELVSVSTALANAKAATEQAVDGRSQVEDAVRATVVGSGSSSGGSLGPLMDEMMHLVTDTTGDLGSDIVLDEPKQFVEDTPTISAEHSDFEDACKELNLPVAPPRLPSPQERLIMRQGMEDEYRALLEHFGTNSNSRRPDDRTAEINLGSPQLPITLTRSSISSTDGPTLPSHILRTRDFAASPPLQKQNPGANLLVPSRTSGRTSPASPSIFTPSSLALTPTDGTALMRGGYFTALGGRYQRLKSPSQVRADSQVIRHAMRMEKHKAVEEAAAVERKVRRGRAAVG